MKSPQSLLEDKYKEKIAEVEEIRRLKIDNIRRISSKKCKKLKTRMTL